MVNCSILGCKSKNERKTAGVSFHLFPDTPELRNICTAATKRKNWVSKQTSTLSSSPLLLHNYTRSEAMNENFLACLKESNEGLDMEDSDLMTKGLRILTNPDSLKTVRVNKDDTALCVSLSISFGYPFKLKMKLVEGSKELKITLRLLKTIQDVRTSEQELRRLLQKKDKEIEEYKCEGGEIALRHLKTVPFNDEAHMVKHTAYSENFGLTEIPESLLNQSIGIPEARQLQVKQETPETNRTRPAVKSESQRNLKTEFLPEQPLKTEPLMSLSCQEIKTEILSQPVKSEAVSQPCSQTGVSPNKRQKRKLNL